MIVMETPPTKRAPISSRWLAWSACRLLELTVFTHH